MVGFFEGVGCSWIGQLFLFRVVEKAIGPVARRRKIGIFNFGKWPTGRRFHLSYEQDADHRQGEYHGEGRDTG